MFFWVDGVCGYLLNGRSKPLTSIAPVFWYQPASPLMEDDNNAVPDGFSPRRSGRGGLYPVGVRTAQIEKIAGKDQSRTHRRKAVDSLGI
ncbi:Hypothetical protein NGAL_HAMBI2566_59310 [Neorhizobium galegae bv. orientalis]|nr:Hypothetical protein NGAL_HAMBI2566_59310 [Neorhizobium galegae bv. orientalis]